jgi:hypothetical protein
MSFLKKLFAGGTKAGSRPTSEIEHEGYHIATTPIPEGSQFRLAANITKEIEGEVRQHRLIRADLFTSADEASEAAIRKAKQVIKEQGDKLFG